MICIIIVVIVELYIVFCFFVECFSSFLFDIVHLVLQDIPEVVENGRVWYDLLVGALVLFGSIQELGGNEYFHLVGIVEKVS